MINGQATTAAILFNATLAVDPGAVFTGAVEALAQYDNILQLTGTGAGVLSGLGTEFSGFRNVQETARANWTLTQSNTLETATGVAVAGTLTVAGSLTDAGVAIVSTGGSLLASGNATVLLGGVALAGGRLGGATGAEITVGNTTEGIVPGQIMVDAGASIVGDGAINGALGVADNGVIEATGGTLTIGIPVSGTGTLEIGSGATLQTGGAVHGVSVLFGPGGEETLSDAKPTSLTSTLSGFGATDVIDLRNLQATSASFLAGTLTLLDGANAVGALAFSGNYDTADFTLMADQQGGTDIAYAGGPLADEGAFASTQHWDSNPVAPWLNAWLTHPFR